MSTFNFIDVAGPVFMGAFMSACVFFFMNPALIVASAPGRTGGGIIDWQCNDYSNCYLCGNAPYVTTFVVNDAPACYVN